MSIKSKRKNWPFVSVVIITKDRKEYLRRVLKSLNRMDYPKNKREIVVIDETLNPLELEGVKHIKNRHLKGFGYGRNLGIKHAKYDLIAFVDDDCVVTKNWLKGLVSTLEEKNASIASGGIRAYRPNIIGKCEETIGYPGGGIKLIKRAGKRIKQTKNISTGNSIFEKNVFNRVGYFNETLKHGGEDTEISSRISKHYDMFFNPNVIIYHQPRGNLVKIFKWFVRRGKAEVEMIKAGSEPFKRIFFSQFLLPFLYYFPYSLLIYLFFLSLFLF